MDKLSVAVQVIMGVAGIIVTLGVPTFLFILRGIREDMRDLNKKLDTHVANYGIHYGGSNRVG